MNLKFRFLTHSVWCCAAAGWLAAGALNLSAADNASDSDKQRPLIELLQSGAPKEDKAIACKRLAIYGTRDAVPALATLAVDPELTSWARIALEAIPGPEAGAALRDVAGKTQGRVLVGIINSLGVRRDAQAVGLLTDKLKQSEADVAAAAAEALGKIGGEAAGKVLEQALAAGTAEVRSAVAEGAILCAEGFLAKGNAAAAVRLYDLVRGADLPPQRVLEGIRGAILARQDAGVPLLLEQLKSPDKMRFGLGLRVARELPGKPATEALVGEIKSAAPERQGPLLMALGDRKDELVLPAVFLLAEQGAPKVRAVAVGILENSGDKAWLPAMLNAATDSDAQLARTAKISLARMGGKEIDAALLARMADAPSKLRQVLIELAGQRRLLGALPAVLKALQDPDAGLRRAAFEALGILGEAPQAADLVKLLQKSTAGRERADIEKGLAVLCGRAGAAAVAHVLPLTQSADAGLRQVGVRVLAGAGGAEALGAVKAAVQDKEADVQDEAVRALAGWPGNWPEETAVAEPLLALAKSSKNPSHQVQGLRGYLVYLQEDKHLGSGEKMAKLRDVLALVQRPEEKRLAIATVSGVGSAEALDLLINFAADAAVAEEACQGILKFSGSDRWKDASAELRKRALQTVVDKSSNEGARKRAQGLLKEP